MTDVSDSDLFLSSLEIVFTKNKAMNLFRRFFVRTQIGNITIERTPQIGESVDTL